MKPAAALVALVLAAVPRSAAAFCGFYVASGDHQMFNDATQVVLMRVGTRTVLSMQNNYKGPPEAFAMVVPVPVVLHEGDVKTLPREVFERVDRMGAPRLVEYWEEDPCELAPEERYRFTRAAVASEDEAVMHGLGVTVEARFAVGEYQVVILSAKDSTGLETWLTREHYRIPAGAEPLLRPYVESGSKFFVARVDPAKLVFDADGRAALSPLRFHYDSDEFALPIRLGLAASSGTQDLIVSILAPMRYEVANYKNVTIPTNLDVAEAMRERFPAFYTALFDRTVEANPGAVVTEYAWQAASCDPCPGPALNQGDFATLGADVVGDARSRAAAPPADLVLTRLHARYGTAISQDLVFRAAEPISGGRESGGSHGELDDGAQPARYNRFQGRYVIRHPWIGPIRCEHPIRKRWGGPPAELGASGGHAALASAVTPAVGLAFAPRGQIELAHAVLRDVPEIGVVAGKSTEPAAGAAAGSAARSPSKAGSAAPATPSAPAGDRSRCGCTSAGGDGLAALLLGAAVLAGCGRRRSRR
jgi:hypothetical protein